MIQRGTVVIICKFKGRKKTVADFIDPKGFKKRLIPGQSNIFRPLQVGDRVQFTAFLDERGLMAAKAKCRGTSGMMGPWKHRGNFLDDLLLVPLDFPFPLQLENFDLERMKLIEACHLLFWIKAVAYLIVRLSQIA